MGGRRWWHAQGATRGRSGVFLGLSFSGCVKCESRQSGRTLLARWGFAAISRRDLHCRVRGGGRRAGPEAGEHGEIEGRLGKWPDKTGRFDFTDACGFFFPPASAR